MTNAEGESAAVSGRGWKLALGPALAAVVILLGPGEAPEVARMAAIAVWMAAWWVTEAVPIPVTALLPLVLLPLAGISPIADARQHLLRRGLAAYA